MAIRSKSLSCGKCTLTVVSHKVGRVHIWLIITPEREQRPPHHRKAPTGTDCPALTEGRYFPTTEIQSVGGLQDGALRFNNPIRVAILEGRRLWPGNCAPDFVLSLGTGTAEVTSPKAPTFRHFLVDGFPLRLYRSFMESLDGEGAWRELKNDVERESRAHYFRLNVNLPEVPEIDDIKCMPKLRGSVTFHPEGPKTCSDVASGLLTSSLFFELDDVPCFEDGHYRCEGSILCRDNAYQVVQGFAKVGGGGLEYLTIEDQHLAGFGGIHAVCAHCHRYCVRVAFYVRSFSEFVTIYLRQHGGQKRRISGFPQTIQWFIEQQRLDAAFGTADFTRRSKCQKCSHLVQKRRRADLAISQTAKRHCMWI